MDATAAAPPGSLRRDVELAGLVGLAHAASHAFHLVLPTLFPWLMAEFDLRFVQAGSLVTAFFVVSGFGQAAAGFVVDRVGPRRVLWAGLSLLALSALLLAAARGYPWLLAAALVAGAGNSVFHPADFTALNQRVAPHRLGPAFSAHALSGNLGWATTPVLLTALAGARGWRTAALAASALALVPLALLVLRRGAFTERAAGGAGHGAAPAGALAFLRVRAVWWCFLFFLVSTTAFGALQAFGPLVFRHVYGLSLQGGAGAQTSYLLGGAAGIAAGGVLAARSEAHERLVAIALGLAAAAAAALATGSLPAAGVPPFLAGVGFLTGFANPSRDLLVRRAALQSFGARSFGRVYGFVYSGVDAGLSLAPVGFGLLMDRGQDRAVLAGVALLQLLAVAVALRVGGGRGEAGPRPQASGLRLQAPGSRLQARGGRPRAPGTGTELPSLTPEA